MVTTDKVKLLTATQWRAMHGWDDLETENKRLKEELKENAAFVYNQAILATPTGNLRNRLTELNILRLQTLKETQ